MSYAVHPIGARRDAFVMLGQDVERQFHKHATRVVIRAIDTPSAAVSRFLCKSSIIAGMAQVHQSPPVTQADTVNDPDETHKSGGLRAKLKQKLFHHGSQVCRRMKDDQNAHADLLLRRVNRANPTTLRMDPTNQESKT